MRLLTLPGVFRPRPDSWMLARAVREEGAAPRARVLDVCTGSGLLAITAARCGAQATAVDVSRRAVLCAAVNARLNRVRIRALRGDLFVPVRGERFDVIISNPPYLPADGDLPARGAARAWEAGRDGRALLDRLCAQAPDHLAPGGVLLVVHSSLCDPGATLDALRAGGLHAEIAVRRRGPLGPLVRARAPELEARGLLIPGQRHEDVVIVRAASQPAVSFGASRGSPACKEHQHGVEVGRWAHHRPPEEPLRGRQRDEKQPDATHSDPKGYNHGSSTDSARISRTSEAQRAS